MAKEAQSKITLLLRADRSVYGLQIAHRDAGTTRFQNHRLPPDWRSVQDWPEQVFAMAIDQVGHQLSLW